LTNLPKKETEKTDAEKELEAKLKRRLSEDRKAQLQSSPAKPSLAETSTQPLAETSTQPLTKTSTQPLAEISTQTSTTIGSAEERILASCLETLLREELLARQVLEVVNSITVSS